MTESTAEYTAPELLAMDDEDFAEVVTDDLKYTASHSSPFQDPEVIRRTLTALIEHLWYIDSVIAKRAEDPNCSAEVYQKTIAFRRHLIASIDLTERRVTWLDGHDARKVSLWKKHLHEVLDQIAGSAEDALLDEMTIPFPTGPLSLRAWREIRNVKDPSRVVKQEVAA
jgi:hypothetical protein